MFSKSSIKFILYLGLITSNSVYAATDCDTLSTIFNSFQIKNKISWPANSNACCSVNGIVCQNNRITEMYV